MESNTISRTGAFDSYSSVVTPALRLLSKLQPVDDTGLERHGRAVAGLAQAREYLSQEDALVAAALAAGRTTQDELDALDERMTQRETAFDTWLPDLPLDDRQAYDGFWQEGTGRVLAATERGIVEQGVSAVQAGQWDDTSAAALSELSRLGDQARDRYEASAGRAATAALLRAGLVALGGLLAVLLSALVALRAGRGHLRELRTLAREAREAADVRLPGVTRRLAMGERVDVETEAPRLDYGPDDIGRVGKAVNTLQRAALSAAVERSATRRGVSDVFVNLARRSQVLLHRQLHLLETAEDTRDRSDLLRLAHLTARMRRHAEGLVILSGAAPSRQWGRPELMMDVVRGAVDEVEDFERIEIHRLPPLAVSGSAVADLTHLIAELLENATVFSPPHTAVQVSGERVPHGFTLEVHDRGLGMTAEALRDANERLSQPADLELTETDRLGLLVVARLAGRHGVRVSLTDSPYGGTTAVTLIPGELLTEADGTGTGAPAEERRRPAVTAGPVELEGAGGGHTKDENEGEPAPADWPVNSDGHEAADEPSSPERPPRRLTPVLVADHGRTVSQPPGTTSAGLPRRNRPPAPPGGPGPAPSGDPQPAGMRAPAAADRDADAVRTRLAALQRGWQRGREQTEAARGHAPPGPQPQTHEAQPHDRT